MLQYVYGHDAAVADFVASLFPQCRRGFGPNVKAIGVIDGDGMLIYGVVYHNYNPDVGVIEISGGALPGKHWLTRETLRRIYTYPFLQVGCQMVMHTTPADDERLLYMLSRYNFAFVTVPRLFGRERDGVVCTLTYEAWASNRFNQRLGHHLEPQSIEEAA